MRGLLFSQMEPPPGWDEGFNEWYDGEHVPERVAIPDIESATRYTAVEGWPRYTVCYHLADLDVLDSDVYRKIRGTRSERTAKYLDNARGFTRYTARELVDEGSRLEDDALLFVHALDVPSNAVDLIDVWYRDCYVPDLGRDVRFRYYAVEPGAVGIPWKRLALHHCHEGPLPNVRCLAAIAGERVTSQGGQHATWLYAPRSTSR